ncbi:MAG: VTT domain-containing protein [Anaerolineales bacterium]|nr:VTT domain-containing protein [Anaerolineales bacterium]
MKLGKYGLTFIRILALLLVIAITIFVYSIRDKAEELAVYGYPGIFVIALLTNATVFLPAPGIAVVFAMGAVFNPLFVGLAAGAGGAIGELSGYLAGFSGQAVVERAKLYERLSTWVSKYGFWAILVLAAIPNPTFDVAGVAAGVLKMPLLKFLLAVLVGVSIKMILFAFAGAQSMTWILRE